MRVAIAGVGGIGSNVAVHLVRSGIKRLTIADYDRVEISNLNRQFYFRDQVGKLKVEMLRENLLRIDSELDIEVIATPLDRSNIFQIFAGCGLIVEGFDRSEDKKMLLESFAGDDRSVVSASGIAGSELENISCRRLGNCFIVGDFTSDIKQAGLYAHKVVAVAAFMSDVILRECGHYAG
ncbi:sulfur carrier protein ThiS adenylyltransferase ThiF [Desulforhopalus sp. IMCC35007]|uniref:sulfur carrier protein ThiS adenylyltransferase ThiF n=1 Tax=Desulforhopalus sp. IMCC35007 TaxID=2569543 RepID=UPI0010AEA08F|nr:sulfur carrier protein ThiS adenylyltransferase ThiF [Desulforhopalus sp. IMCC35007]TKB12348.1 sulfur carrier protein ThiS adenylyltransferase ThiF [Desulforhopalus sp. IMCC35007]